MKTYVLLFLSLLLFLLTLEPLHLSWASWVMFVPAFVAILKKPQPILVSLFGLVLGLSFTAGAIYWSFPYDISIATKIILLSGIPFAIFFGALATFLEVFKPNLNQKKDLILVVSAPVVLWLLLWMLLGMSPVGALPMEIEFYQSLPFMQLVSFAGMPALIALILLVNTSIALWIHQPKKFQKSILITFSSVALVVYFAGAIRVVQNPPVVGETKIALVQTNLEYQEEWRIEHKDEILETYTELTRKAAESRPEIIVFPQYSIPLDVLREPTFMAELARRANAYVILASYVPQVEGRPIEEVGFSNVGFVFSPTEGLIGEYRSVVGPPFKEAEQYFGDEYPTLSTPVGNIGLLLCYEDTVRWVAKKWMEKDIDVFFAITNPGTFKGNVMPLYQLQQDRVRALENNRSIVRVTPNGYSAVIDRFGRIRVLSKLQTQEIIITHL